MDSLKEAEEALVSISRNIEGPLKGCDFFFEESDHYWVLAALAAVRAAIYGTEGL